MDKEADHDGTHAGVSNERTASVSVFAESTEWVCVIYRWANETKYICCNTDSSQFLTRSEMGVFLTQFSAHYGHHEFTETTYPFLSIEYYTLIFTFQQRL
jgi:hypothetical protein